MRGTARVQVLQSIAGETLLAVGSLGLLLVVVLLLIVPLVGAT